MSLGSHWRLSLQNSSGSTGTYTAKAIPWKFASDGSIIYGSEITLLSGVSITTGNWSNSATQDNTTNKWIGLHITVSSATSIAHQITVQRQVSTDAGTTWGDDGYGISIGAAVLSSAGALDANFEAP